MVLPAALIQAVAPPMGAPPALAHGSAGTLGAIDLVPAAVAVVSILAYLAGVRVLRRSPAGRRTVSWPRVAGFLTGVLVATAVITTPVDHLAHELFAAHMAQHLVLAGIAAPLLVVGRPVLVGSVVLGHRGAWATTPARRWAVRLRAAPAGAALLGVVHVLPWYVWHLPGPYDLALRSDLVHAAEHVTLVISGAALTWLAAGRAPAVASLAVVVVGMVSMGLIAALLALAPTALYGAHTETLYGFSPVESQQVGGALMWFPGSLGYLVAGGVIVLRELATKKQAVRARAVRSEPPVERVTVTATDR